MQCRSNHPPTRFNTYRSKFLLWSVARHNGYSTFSLALRASQNHAMVYMYVCPVRMHHVYITPSSVFIFIPTVTIHFACFYVRKAQKLFISLSKQNYFQQDEGLLRMLSVPAACLWSECTIVLLNSQPGIHLQTMGWKIKVWPN